MKTLPALTLLLGIGFAVANSKEESIPRPDAKRWPDRVEIPANLPISQMGEASAAAMSRSLPSGKKWHVYQTKNFQLLSDQSLAAGSSRELGRLLEATWELNCRLPMNWEPTVPDGQQRFTVRVFARSADYYTAAGPRGSGGVYLADKKEVLVPSRSLGGEKSTNELKIARQTEEQGTLVHEVTHLMMHAWLPNLPLWFSEGAAEYVAAADYSSGDFRMRHHLKHVAEKLNRRLPAAKKGLQAVGLGEFLSMTDKTWKTQIDGGKSAPLYGTALALTAYFYHGDAVSGKEPGNPVFLFLDEIRKGVPFRGPLGKHLLRGRSPTELEAAISAFWAKHDVRLSFAPLAREKEEKEGE